MAPLDRLWYVPVWGDRWKWGLYPESIRGLPVFQPRPPWSRDFLASCRQSHLGIWTWLETNRRSQSTIYSRKSQDPPPIVAVLCPTGLAMRLWATHCGAGQWRPHGRFWTASPCVGWVQDRGGTLQEYSIHLDPSMHPMRTRRAVTHHRDKNSQDINVLA